MKMGQRERKRKKRRPNHMVLRRYFPLWVKKTPEFSFTLKAGKLTALL